MERRYEKMSIVRARSLPEANRALRARGEPSLPYLLVHHLRGGDGGHLRLLAHRLRHAGRALIDLLPHRIVAGARK